MYTLSSFEKLFVSCKTVGFQLTKGLLKNTHPHPPLRVGGGVFQKIEIFILKYFVANNLNHPHL